MIQLKENIKTEYLKFLFSKTKNDLARYNISHSETDFVNSLFDRLTVSKNLLVELYILSNIKEFSSLGKYLVFILKKIEDNTINFDNLSFNLNGDTEYIQNEILNYLSNPKLRESIEFKFPADESESHDIIDQKNENSNSAAAEERFNEQEQEELTSEEESKILSFKKNYLELIQSDTDNEDFVYELPGANNDIKEESEEESEKESSVEIPKQEEISSHEEDKLDDFDRDDTDEETVKEFHEESFVIKKKIASEELEDIIEENLLTKKKDSGGDPEEDEKTEGKRIQLSNEISEEIESYQESEDIDDDEIVEKQTTNAIFVEFENEVIENNEHLNTSFEKMVGLLDTKDSEEEERLSVIMKIIEISTHIEQLSRKMSLEIISNVYQTISLSFEKISEGKYDLSESTITLFRNGLSLVVSLIKGDDYFGYKDILKSIENIRNTLLEDKEKRKNYQEQIEKRKLLEENLNLKYPDEYEKVKLAMLKQLIKDTDNRFKAIDKITGEYQIYETLRSLSGNLSNLKEIVTLSKALKLTKLVQLAEASYIFIKFLQNYRINPVTIELKEIFGYITYNMKSLVLDKPVEDIDLFISHLNDPVKIFSKTDKKT